MKQKRSGDPAVGGGALPAAATAVPALRLPTLQRNALCKLFGRSTFTPQEVFALGYRRLQRAEGIGHKGLQAIIEWLAAHGLVLAPPSVPADPPPEVPAEIQRSINGAVRLLRHHGYRVQRTRDQCPE